MPATIQDAQWKAAFTNLRKLGVQPRTWLGPVGAAIANNTRLRFTSSQAPDGSTWKPVLRGGQPLRDTGQLMNSIHSELADTSVTIGTPLGWAIVHQKGMTINAKSAPYLRFKIGNRSAMKRSVTIPRRTIFGISTQDRADVQAIVGGMIRSAAAVRAGGVA